MARRRKPSIDDVGELLDSGEFEAPDELPPAPKGRAKDNAGPVSKLDPKKIKILDPEFTERTFVVIGANELVTHRWTEKAKKQLRDDQQGIPRPKKEPKDPNEEFMGSLYPMGPDARGVPRYGIPAAAFKKAMVRACSLCEGIPMTAAKCVMFVVGEQCLVHEEVTPGQIVEQTVELLEIFGDGPYLREDAVRVGKFPSRSADLRYRGTWRKWAVKVPVSWMANILTIEQVANLLKLAGFCVGVGEDRPEKQGGSWGTWRVAKSEAEFEAIRKLSPGQPGRGRGTDGRGAGRQASGRSQASGRKRARRAA